MSKFAEVAGFDVSGLRRWIGMSTTNEGPGEGVRGVQYVPIDMAEANRFLRFYEDEPAINTVDQALDSFSLDSGVEYSFMGAKLDDEKFNIAKPLRAKIQAARKHYHTIGCVAVRSRQVALDNVVATAESGIGPAELHSGGPSAPLKRQLDHATSLVESINRFADAKDVSVFKEAVEDGDVTTDGDQVQRIRTLPKTSMLFAASERMEPVSEPAPTLDGERKRKREPSIDGDQQQQKSGTVSRSMEDVVRDLGNLTIVDLSRGQLYVEVVDDEVTRMVYSRTGAEEAARRGHGLGASAEANGVDIDTSVFVYVWPGRMPARDGRLVTKMRRVLDEFDVLNRARLNAEIADYDLSHKRLILQSPPPQSTLHTSQVDQVVLGGAGGGMTAAAEMTARDEAINEFVTKFAVAASNGRRNAETAAKMREFRKSWVRGGNDAVDASNIDMGDIEPIMLPPGVTVAANVPQATTHADVLMQSEVFLAALFHAIGVPRALADNGTSVSGRNSKGSGGGASSNVSTASAGLSDDAVRRSVKADRTMAEDFVQGLYNIMNRRADNATLQSLVTNVRRSTRKAVEATTVELAEIKRKLSVIATLTEQDTLNEVRQKQSDSLRTAAMSHEERIRTLVARLEQVQSEVLAIIMQPYRLTVKFSDISFAEISGLDGLVEIGAISGLTRVNAALATYGWPPITEAEYKKNLKELDARAASVVKANAPPQQAQAPGGGAAAGKAASDNPKGASTTGKKDDDDKQAAKKSKTGSAGDSDKEKAKAAAKKKAETEKKDKLKN